MRNRVLASLGSVGAVIALAWLAPAPSRPERLAPKAPAPTAPTAAKKWTPPKTSWGDPDLQGAWNSQTSTPLERPRAGDLASKENLTDQEAAAFRSGQPQDFRTKRPGPADTGTYNACSGATRASR